jgi:aminopeptidase YwaD
MVLELARAASVSNLEGDCFVLFSGEEEGLVGSTHFVTSMTQQERDELAAYFNYDVVAGGARINVVGDDALATRAVDLGTQAGDDIVLGQLPSNASSDFAGFLLAGLPAIMLTVDDLGVLHTVRDTFDFAQQHTEPLQPIADLAFALMQDVLRQSVP